MKDGKLCIRSAYQWGSSTTQRIRTLATTFETWEAAVPEDLAILAAELLSLKNLQLFPVDSTALLRSVTDKRGPSSRQLKSQFVAACEEYREQSKAVLQGGFEINLCREVCFHSDEYYSEDALYLVWVLGVEGELTFHSVGKSTDIKAGTVLVFDAQNLHALLKKGKTEFKPYGARSPGPRMVFAISSIKLNPYFLNRLGMVVEADNAEWVSMANANYCTLTGCIEGIC